jgi:hypothetical protein
MEWAGYVARLGHKRNAYTGFRLENLKKIGDMNDLVIDEGYY